MENPVFTFRNLYEAYLNCRKGKRGKRNALAFEFDAEANLVDLLEQLKSRTYKPLPSVCFVTESPKPREIFAADFRDRIVHHLIVSCIEPGWESKFIYDSYACRRKKGIHQAAKRLQKFMRQASLNDRRKAWFMKLDIRSFFVSIDKKILFEILTKKKLDADMRWLLEVVVFNDPAENPIKKGRLSLFDQIPPYKSLFYTKNKTGLPIGNYTSQFFANVYLDRLDQFVKHELKCRFYIRYVDDMVMAHHKPERLAYYADEIEKFCRTRLRLAMNPNQKKLAPVRNGCDFLGYIVRPSHLLARRRVVNNLKSKLAMHEARLVKRNADRIAIRCAPGPVDMLQSTLASYLGHFGHASTFNLRNSIFRRNPFLNCYFVLLDSKAVRIDKPPRFRNLPRQYRWFVKTYPNALLLFQIGRFFEFFGKNAERAETIRPFKLGPVRKGLGARRGIHRKHLGEFARQALAKGQTLVIATQTGLFSGRVMERRTDWIVEPAARSGIATFSGLRGKP